MTLRNFCPFNADHDLCHENCALFDMEYQRCSLAYHKRIAKELELIRRELESK